MEFEWLKLINKFKTEARPKAPAAEEEDEKEKEKTKGEEEPKIYVDYKWVVSANNYHVLHNYL